MAQISFSIVVVCLNPGEKLLKTVQSVLNQKYGNYEIVVKDGGSTDGSLEQLPADSRIRVYTRPVLCDRSVCPVFKLRRSFTRRYGTGTACSCDGA